MTICQAPNPLTPSCILNPTSNSPGASSIIDCLPLTLTSTAYYAVSGDQARWAKMGGDWCLREGGCCPQNSGLPILWMHRNRHGNTIFRLCCLTWLCSLIVSFIYAASHEIILNQLGSIGAQQDWGRGIDDRLTGNLEIVLIASATCYNISYACALPDSILQRRPILPSPVHQGPVAGVLPDCRNHRRENTVGTDHHGTYGLQKLLGLGERYFASNLALDVAQGDFARAGWIAFGRGVTLGAGEVIPSITRGSRSTRIVRGTSLSGLFLEVIFSLCFIVRIFAGTNSYFAAAQTTSVIRFSLCRYCTLGGHAQAGLTALMFTDVLPYSPNVVIVGGTINTILGNQNSDQVSGRGRHDPTNATENLYLFSPYAAAQISTFLNFSYNEAPKLIREQQRTMAIPRLQRQAGTNASARELLAEESVQSSQLESAVSMQRPTLVTPGFLDLPSDRFP
ncbi:hypothetical protein BDK51DRAFT_38326 [Blyttiomyces helicus]|uniref:Uncharacterized protein n=1 Tax=Blyttiomyces helicus TaxID=388810 RepID=A0A4P9WRH9_9FUNG|nr:hypothetical protein BDK51DRAFT_38326 [Blyttiomyces helicus]|eukprot:RKO94478.1 hypothetical protein BDK51DRAFT_38326 [Blyttiomyces helicus]